MKTNRTILISGRVDAATKAWIEKHPLSQSDLINYGLHLLRMIESNIKEAQTYISSVSFHPKKEDTLPF